MKNLTKTLIFGSMLLSSFFALSIKQNKEVEEPAFLLQEANLNDDFIKMKRASDASTSNQDIGVGPAIAQKIDLPNGRTTIRFVAPARVQSLTKVDENLQMVTGGEFGFKFHYVYGGQTFDVKAKSNNFFLSVKAGEKGFVANELSAFSSSLNYGKMDDFYSVAFNETKENEYNTFITMEMRNIPSDFANAIEATPYVIKEGSQEIELAKYTKKADTTGVPFSEIKVDGMNFDTMDIKTFEEPNSRNKIRFVVDINNKLINPNIGGFALSSINTLDGHYYTSIQTDKSLKIPSLDLNFDIINRDHNKVSFNPDFDLISASLAPNFTFQNGKIYRLFGLEANDKVEEQRFTYKVEELDAVYLKERQTNLTLNEGQKIEVKDSLGRVISSTVSSQNGDYEFNYDGKNLNIKEPGVLDIYQVNADSTVVNIDVTDDNPLIDGITSSDQYMIKMDGIIYIVNGVRITPKFLYQNYYHAFDSNKMIKLETLKPVPSYHQVHFDVDPRFNGKFYDGLLIKDGDKLSNLMMPNRSYKDYEVNAWVDGSTYLDARKFELTVDRDIVLKPYISVRSDKFKYSMFEGKRFIDGYKMVDKTIHQLFLPAFDDHNNRIYGVDSDAFANVEELDTIIIPDGYERINNCAFANSFNNSYYEINGEWTKIYLPDSLTIIAEDAFFINFDIDYKYKKYIAEDVQFYTTNRDLFKMKLRAYYYFEDGVAFPRWYGEWYGISDTSGGLLNDEFLDFDGNILQANHEFLSKI